MKRNIIITPAEPLRRDWEPQDQPQGKEPQRVVIGIDPGASCGIAWRVGKQPMQVKTVSLMQCFAMLAQIVQQHGVARVKVWIEDARMNRPVFDRGQSRKATLKIAQNVGSVKRDTDLLEQHCRLLGLSPMMIRPTTAKWTTQQMLAATGISRSSQHARDAAKLIVGR